MLCFAAGNSGGIARDIMIGSVPPAAINDWTYLAVSFLAGLVTFVWYPLINKLSSPVLLFDAAGLRASSWPPARIKHSAYHVGPVGAILFGTLTGIGGGMMRDVLLREIPTVLRTDIYALAALIGATAIIGGHALNLASFPSSASIGAVLCFLIRLGAMRYGSAASRCEVSGRPAFQKASFQALRL